MINLINAIIRFIITLSSSTYVITHNTITGYIEGIRFTIDLTDEAGTITMLLHVHTYDVVLHDYTGGMRTIGHVLYDIEGVLMPLVRMAQVDTGAMGTIAVLDDDTITRMVHGLN